MSAGRWVLPGGATGFVEPPRTCNACGEPLLTSNELCDDGCPCNSPRGANYPPQRCAWCRTDNCVKPAHRKGDFARLPVPAMGARLECEHGSLRRQCALCDTLADLAAERARADRAEEALRAAREQVRAEAQRALRLLRIPDAAVWAFAAATQDYARCVAALAALAATEGADAT